MKYQKSSREQKEKSNIWKMKKKTYQKLLTNSVTFLSQRYGTWNFSQVKVDRVINLGIDKCGY